MSAAQKRKGVQYESDLRALFREHGIPAYRPAQQGAHDVGDLHGIPPFVGQAKAWTTDLLAGIREGLKGAEVQAPRAGQPFGVAFVKRPRKSIAEGYAVLYVRTFARALARLQAAEGRLALADHVSYLEHVEEHS